MEEQTSTSDVSLAGPTGEQIEQAVGAYQRVFLRYQLMADYLTDLLRFVTGEWCKTAIVQTRPKAPASVAGKIVKRWPKYQNPVDEMTDLCGARVIVPFLREATNVTAWLKAHFAVREYEDMLERLQPWAFGYRGEHLLVNIDPRLLPKELVSQDVLDEMPEVAKPLTCPTGQPGQSKNIKRLRSRLLLTDEPPILDADLWRELHGLTAEIQVRTMAQHVWSDVGHDRIYKSPVLLPDAHHRSNAKIAALLEAVDEELGDLVDKIEVIQKNARRYLDEAEAEREIARLKAVLSVDAGNLGLACEIVRSQLSIGDCEGAEKTIDDYEKAHGGDQIDLDVLRGRVLVTRHRGEPKAREAFERGRQLLAARVSNDQGGVEAATALAEAWAIDENDTKARRAIEKAYAIDPTDPRALTGYLRYHIVSDQGTDRVRLSRPDVERAMDRCRQQIAARANLPDALFLLAELHLVMEDSHNVRRERRSRKQSRENKHRELQSTYEGLYAACRAVTLTPAGSVATLDEFSQRMTLLDKHASNDVPGAAWARTVVELARCLRSPEDEGAKGDRLPIENGDPLPTKKRPVLIVGGGCDMSDGVLNAQQRRLVEAVAAEFEGVIVSGGTEEGIAGLVGKLCKQRNDHLGAEIITTVGYLAANLDEENATRDGRYTEHRRTQGWMHGFSPLEPLQNWMDLIASSVQPENVRLLGIGGGKIAAFEYHLAAALGAQTAVIRGSGREADRLMLEENHPGNENIVFLPSDTETVRAFVGELHRESPMVIAIEKKKACLADQINAAYKDLAQELQSSRISKDIKRTFHHSNLEQAQHIAAKLRRIGLEIAQLDDPRGEQPLPDEKVKELARMEHGRWVVERTLRGWRLGTTRDDDKKTRPQLVPWDELPHDERQKDTNTVRKIPDFLRACNLKIVKLVQR